MRILEAPAIGDQITMGKLHFYRREFYDLERTSRLSWQEEQRRFLDAQSKAAVELRQLYDRAAAEMDKAEADIFAIHAMLLEDEELTAQVLDMIRADGVTALIGVPLTAEMEGTPALMDGHTGLLYLEPTVDLTEYLRRKYERGGCPEPAEV